MQQLQKIYTYNFVSGQGASTHLPGVWSNLKEKSIICDFHYNLCTVHNEKAETQSKQTR